MMWAMARMMLTIICSVCVYKHAYCDHDCDEGHADDDDDEDD